MPPVPPAPRRNVNIRSSTQYSRGRRLSKSGSSIRGSGFQGEKGFAAPHIIQRMTSAQAEPHPPDWRQSRWLAIAELAVIGGIFVADHRFRVIPLSETPFMLLVGWISLRLRGLRWRDLGLARPASWGRSIALGLVAGIAMELISTFVTVPFFTRMTGKPPDLAEFKPLVGNLVLVLELLIPAWILAAFGEELVHRGYLLNRLADLGGRGRGAWIAAIVLGSAFFGWCHEYQDWTGILQEGLAGLVLGLLYFANRRNLTVPIVAHGVSNTVAFLLIYLDKYPGV